MAEEKKQVKSALDIAMARFGASATGPALSARQKQRLGEIEKSYNARVTEKTFVFDERIRNALREGDLETAEKIRVEKTQALRKFKQEMEAEKESARNAIEP